MSALKLINKKTQQMIDVLKKYYLEDERPFAVGYSGGKDSSVTLDLVFKMLLQVTNPTKAVYVQFSDTLLEMDPVVDGINQSFVNIQNFADKHNLPVIIKRVEPELKHTFFSLLIGKGYTLPRRDYRWCTDRLKIKPQQKAINHLLQEFGGFISVTGVRKAESADRAIRIDKNTIDGIYKTHDLQGCNMLTPIQDYSSDEVWSYLYTEALEWVDATELGRVYSEAAGDGGECRTLLEGVDGEQAGCSKSARYGCWLCHLFKEDKTLKNLAVHYDYMKDMEQFRNWLQSFQIDNWAVRDVYNHRDHNKKINDLDNHRKGMVLPGGYTLSFRKEILRRLIELDRRVYPARGTHLITSEELQYIQECWIEEGDYKMSAFNIADDRELSISKQHKEIRDSVLIYKDRFFVEPDEVKGKVQRWFAPYWRCDTLEFYKDERYYAQLSKQIQKIDLDPIEMALREFQNDVLLSLPANTTQFFPTEEDERYIRWEWSNDKIGLLTMLRELDGGNIEIPSENLFGYDGDLGLHFEQLDELNEKFDITLCESISLEDKMAYFN